MAISNQHRLIALAAAITLHLSLLLINVSVDVPLTTEPRELDIRLLDETPELTPPPLAPEEVTALEDTLQEDIPVVEELPVEEPPIDKPPIEPTPPEEPPEKIIVAKPAPENQDQPRVQINVNSDEFRRFLRNEVDAYQATNPTAIDEFNQTFEPLTVEADEVSSISLAGRNQIQQVGVGQSQDKNGKRTCFAQIPNINDSNGPQTLLSKDCTPPKKFILDLDKPRNN